MEYVTALEDRKAAEARERQAKATVLDLLGISRYAVVGSIPGDPASGVKVARRQANKTGFQLNQVAKSTTDIPAVTAADLD